MANATDRYIFSDTGDDTLHEIVTKFPDMFVYADEFDDANIAERAKDILDNLAEIFGSDEQED